MTPEDGPGHLPKCLAGATYPDIALHRYTGLPLPTGRCTPCGHHFPSEMPASTLVRRQHKAMNSRRCPAAPHTTGPSKRADIKVYISHLFLRVFFECASAAPGQKTRARHAYPSDGAQSLPSPPPHQHLTGFVLRTRRGCWKSVSFPIKGRAFCIPSFLLETKTIRAEKSTACHAEKSNATVFRAYKPGLGARKEESPSFHTPLPDGGMYGFRMRFFGSISEEAGVE